MTTKFTGEIDQKVDSKGRMSVPADFRRALEAGDPHWQPGQPVRAQLIYGDHLHERVQVYSMIEFDKIVDRIAAMPDSDPNKDNVTHLMITQSEPLGIDKDGRTVMALKHRQKLGIESGELSFRGRITHFEIWKKSDYVKEVTAPVKDYLRDKPKNFNPLSDVP